MTFCKNCEKWISFHPILKQWVHVARNEDGKVVQTFRRSCRLMATPKT